MRDIDIVKSKTENQYNKKSALSKLLQSLNQKINSPKQRRRN
tara:strand:- start:76 stop:201 length:126 start_codon:yes stop_codon:yes gene_type:complete